jgi:hypothetical protein
MDVSINELAQALYETVPRSTEGLPSSPHSRPAWHELMPETREGYRRRAADALSAVLANREGRPVRMGGS